MRLISVALVMALTVNMGLSAKEIGVVNFSQCMMKSKLGEIEKSRFEKEQQDVSSKLQKLGEELQRLLTQLNDSDYLSTLNPEAQQEMQEEFQSKNQTYNQEYSAYTKLIEEKKTHFFEIITEEINQATDSVAKKEGFPTVLNSEAVIYYQPQHDLTSKVIKQMDQQYLQKQKDQAN